MIPGESATIDGYPAFGTPRPPRSPKRARIRPKASESRSARPTSNRPICRPSMAQSRSGDSLKIVVSPVRVRVSPLRKRRWHRGFLLSRACLPRRSLGTQSGPGEPAQLLLEAERRVFIGDPSLLETIPPRSPVVAAATPSRAMRLGLTSFRPRRSHPTLSGSAGCFVALLPHEGGVGQRVEPPSESRFREDQRSPPSLSLFGA